VLSKILVFELRPSQDLSLRQNPLF